MCDWARDRFLHGIMSRLFGTDGVRGVANANLSPELAFKLGFAGALVLGRGKFVIGRDPRASGRMLEAAVVAGACAAGADALLVGVMPTPAIAYLTKALEAAGGVAISASHNPAIYNGIKFFNSEGFKLSDELEEKIESSLSLVDEAERPTGSSVGRVADDRSEAEELYIEHALSVLGGSLDGIRIAVDCANGAAYRLAPEVLRRAGAQVEPLCCSPDGENINRNCGSTHIDFVRSAVLEGGYDIGLAHDGDADRVLAVDSDGEVVDGDFIMAICGAHMKEKGLLPNDEIVVTVMTNMGFDIAMREIGIRVVKTKVGDRYVLDEMLRRGAGLGGEQSGHVIFLEHATTGDGIITALRLLDVMRETGLSLSELRKIMRRLPQVLLNVHVPSEIDVLESRRVKESIAAAEKRLGDSGRILVRASGTEPLVRVMVEAPTVAGAHEIAAEVAEVISAEIEV